MLLFEEFYSVHTFNIAVQDSKLKKINLDETKKTQTALLLDSWPGNERWGGEGVPVEMVWVTTFGAAQFMNKEERGEVAWATSFMHIHEPPVQVTEAAQHGGHSEGPAGLVK